jgi:tetratricopeptide (TPR) repeat protein
MGLSIGVHLLNLLTIPVLTVIYFYKKYNYSHKGLITSLAAGVGILVFVQYGIIPGAVKVASWFELFMVNTLHTPFNYGLLVYGIFIGSLIVFLLYFTRKRNLFNYNLAVWCVAVIIIGYSSYAMIYIRSNANPPMDENDPSDVFSLISYLNREQYGDRPLLYGQHFESKLDRQKPYNDGGNIYLQSYSVVNSRGKVLAIFGDELDAKNYIENNKEETLSIKQEYVVTDKKLKPNYASEDKMLFPRMWSTEARHAREYRFWGNISPNEKPNFANNIRFFVDHQIFFMYFRYFMWNFSGRQNDTQGHGEVTNGNWISGIPFLNSWRSGTQNNLPDHLKNNPGRNKYYMLPLLLGILGLLWQYKNDKNSTFTVFLLFFMTGLAIILYLNQTPLQPRERDYAYAGSFYAFCIWIGMGVFALFDLLKNKISKDLLPTAAKGVTALSLVAVPTLMAVQNWDDHDRSDRYTARDFAYNYLNSCAPNAIIFTNGDNDTFPLWYLQEVEGVRTDIRVVNMSLLNTDWYITQMKRQAYEGLPVPFRMNEYEYRSGLRDQVLFDKSSKKVLPLKEAMDWLLKTDGSNKEKFSGNNLYYLPTNKFTIPIDSAKVASNGTVSAENLGRIENQIYWEVERPYFLKSEVMILDLLSNFNWERPIYFAVTVGNDFYGLEKYFQLEGLAYRLMPYPTKAHDGQTGEVAADIMFDNMINKFRWGNMNKPNVYLDETNLRMTYNFRNNFVRLAGQLIQNNEREKAKKALDFCQELMPDSKVPYNYFNLLIADTYQELGEFEISDKICEQLIERYTQELGFYAQLPGSVSRSVDDDKRRAEIIVKTANDLLGKSAMLRMRSISTE